MVEKTIKVLNKAGLHARPSSLIVKAVSKYSSSVFLGTAGNMINAKSIMGVMTLGASFGTEITIQATGNDEKEAVESLERLFENKFADEE